MDKIYVRGYSTYPIPYLDINNYEFDKGILKLCSKQLMKKYCSIPLDIFEGILTFTMGIPMLETINVLEKQINKKIRIFRSKEIQIINKINELY